MHPRIKQFLKGRGYRQINNGIDGQVQYAKTIEGASICQLNDRSPQFVVERNLIKPPQKNFDFYSIKIKAQSFGGQSIALESYGIEPKELKQRIPIAEKSLIAAWEAVNSVAWEEWEPE